MAVKTRGYAVQKGGDILTIVAVSPKGRSTAVRVLLAVRERSVGRGQYIISTGENRKHRGRLSVTKDYLKKYDTIVCGMLDGGGTRR